MDSVRDGRAHSCSTLTLRVPAADWPMIVAGRATEFRMGAHAGARNEPPLPIPAVLFQRQRRGSAVDEMLVTIVGHRVEALGAISAEGLKRAGFLGPREEAFARFRRHMVNSERKRFEPLREVVVWTLRDFVPEDVERCGAAIVQRLYGSWLPK